MAIICFFFFFLREKYKLSLLFAIITNWNCKFDRFGIASFSCLHFKDPPRYFFDYVFAMNANWWRLTSQCQRRFLNCSTRQTQTHTHTYTDDSSRMRANSKFKREQFPLKFSAGIRQKHNLIDVNYIYVYLYLYEGGLIISKGINIKESFKLY